MAGDKITNVDTPTTSTDAATKGYVDSLFSCDQGGQSCTVGIGECQNSGINVCESNVAQCSVTAGIPTAEICDSLDNDCDGEVDEDVTTTFYEDGDGDGFGNLASFVEACLQPDGFVTDNSDCDDGQASVNPAQMEICDGLDNDCNGVTPDGVDEVWFSQPCDGVDTDSCNEGILECSAGAQTCSDTTSDNVEVCDSLDNDCDGSIDEGGVCLVCGNNEIDVGEDCDGTEFGAQTCASFGFNHGFLVCQVTCIIDSSLCSTCGNGVREGIEQCDDGNNDNTDDCKNTCLFQ